MDKNANRNTNYFKYKLERGGGSMYTPRDLNWIDKVKYWLKGYKITKLY